MAQARVAGAAILGTVTDTANAVSGLVNSVSGGLDMVNNYVRHMKEKQRFDQHADMLTYKERRVEELSVEEAERKKKIGDLLKDPELTEYYNSAYAKLKSLLSEG